MSRDDTVGVVKNEGVWWVGVHFADNYHTIVNNERSKQFDIYENALVYAHQLQSKVHTEYGVQVYD